MRARVLHFHSRRHEEELQRELLRLYFRSNPRLGPFPGAVYYHNRNTKIRELRWSGESYRSIGSIFGITPARVGEICRR
jgi:hypothetical protein